MCQDRKVGLRRHCRGTFRRSRWHLSYSGRAINSPSYFRCTRRRPALTSTTSTPGGACAGDMPVKRMAAKESRSMVIQLRISRLIGRSLEFDSSLIGSICFAAINGAGACTSQCERGESLGILYRGPH